MTKQVSLNIATIWKDASNVRQEAQEILSSVGIIIIHLMNQSEKCSDDECDYCLDVNHAIYQVFWYGHGS